MFYFLTNNKFFEFKKKQKKKLWAKNNIKNAGKYENEYLSFVKSF